MSDIDDALDWNLGQDDPHDHYPWQWTPYLDDCPNCRPTIHAARSGQ